VSVLRIMIESLCVAALGFTLNLVYIYTRFGSAAPSVAAFCNLTFTI
jgi:hypothetical protein